jgi:hypothetical protein
MNVVALLAYIFTIGATMLLIGGLPVALLSLGLEYCRSRSNGRAFGIAGFVAVGFLLGGSLAWLLLPSSWNMSLWKTIGAAFSVGRYSHEIEHRAEQVLLYMLFFANLGAIATGIVAATITRASPFRFFHA